MITDAAKSGPKRRPGAKISENTKKIVELLKLDLPGTEIAKRVGVSRPAVYSVKKRFKDDINAAKVLKNNVNIEKFNEDLEDILKTNIVRLGNTIASKDLTKASVNQLATSLSILYDKLRLHQGKSTSNSAVEIVASFRPEQLEIIQEAIKSLKKSMLS